MERGNFSAAAGFGAFKADRFGVFRYVTCHPNFRSRLLLVAPSRRSQR